jgi:dynein heavy chain
MQEANPSLWQRFFFSMCFFHAITQERNKFGYLGWNRPYEFSLSDLSVSLHNISLFMEKNIVELLIPWRMISYIVTEIIYGG